MGPIGPGEENLMGTRSTVIGFAFLMLAVLCATAQAAPTFTITDIGTLGGSSSVGYGLNNAGTVVGTARIANSSAWHAFRWENGVIQDISGVYGESMGVNSAGHAAVSVSIDSNWRACVWADGVLTDIGSLGGPDAWAGDINDSDMVVGQSSLTSGAPHAFIWDGEMHDLGVLLGGSTSTALGVNVYGDVAGWSTDEFDDQHAVLWSAGEIYDLGYGIAEGVNALQQVVGWTNVGGRSLHGVVWEDGVRTDLGAFSATYNSYAYAINDMGWIVGMGNSNYGLRAALWQGGVLCDLNDLIPAGSGWQLRYAWDVNSNGQIVGFGLNPDGESHGFLLTPVAVPAPGAIVLGMIGVAIVGVVRKRKS